MGLAETWPTLANKRQRETRKQACAPRMWFDFQIYQRHEEQYGSTHVRTHTHIVLARVQYEENRPAHLVLHTRDKQLKVRRMQGISPGVATYACECRRSTTQCYQPIATPWGEP